MSKESNCTDETPHKWQGEEPNLALTGVLSALDDVEEEERMRPRTLAEMREQNGLPALDETERDFSHPRVMPEGLTLVVRSYTDERNKIRLCAVPGCMSNTLRPSGMCQAHEQVFGRFSEEAVKQCMSCDIRSFCPNGNNALGFCVYELNEANLTGRNFVADVMTRTINMQLKHVMRMDRVLALKQHDTETQKTETALMKSLKDLLLMLRDYATFMGWSGSQKDKELVKTKIRLIERIFEKGKRRKAMKENVGEPTPEVTSARQKGAMERIGLPIEITADERASAEQVAPLVEQAEAACAPHCVEGAPSGDPFEAALADFQANATSAPEKSDSEIADESDPFEVDLDNYDVDDDISTVDIQFLESEVEDHEGDLEAYMLPDVSGSVTTETQRTKRTSGDTAHVAQGEFEEEVYRR